MSPLALKLLVLDANENSDVEHENQQNSRKGLLGPPKLNQGTYSGHFFLSP